MCWMANFGLVSMPWIWMVQLVKWRIVLWCMYMRKARIDWRVANLRRCYASLGRKAWTYLRCVYEGHWKGKNVLRSGYAGRNLRDGIRFDLRANLKGVDAGCVKMWNVQWGTEPSLILGLAWGVLMQAVWKDLGGCGKLFSHACELSMIELIEHVWLWHLSGVVMFLDYYCIMMF